MCDAFLVLAQAPGGLSCFLLPRVLPDGTRNGFRIERLKDKLGDRSNASSEIELADAWARARRGGGPRRPDDRRDGRAHAARLRPRDRRRDAAGRGAGDAPRGAPARRSAPCSPSSRSCRACSPTSASSRRPPRSTALRLARAYDRRGADAREAAFARIATAVAKYWICKRGPGHAAEALECLGGNGYVEESGLPRRLPAAAAPVDLGGVGQRRLPRRPAGARAGARVARRAPRRDPARGRPGARRDRRAGGRRGGREPARASRSSGSRSRSRHRCSSGTRRPRSPTRSGRPGSARRAGYAYGALPVGVDAAAIIDRNRPNLD